MVKYGGFVVAANTAEQIGGGLNNNEGYSCDSSTESSDLLTKPFDSKCVTSYVLLSKADASPTLIFHPLLLHVLQ